MLKNDFKNDQLKHPLGITAVASLPEVSLPGALSSGFRAEMAQGGFVFEGPVAGPLIQVAPLAVLMLTMLPPQRFELGLSLFGDVLSLVSSWPAPSSPSGFCSNFPLSVRPSQAEIFTTGASWPPSLLLPAPVLDLLFPILPLPSRLVSLLVHSK